MERFRLTTSDLPLNFYRVQYPGTWTNFDEEGRLAAKDTESTHSTESSLRDAVIDAFKWNSYTPSPFIIVFSDRDHAERWAVTMSKSRGECEVFTIDTRQLDGVHIFKLSTLVDKLGIKLPEKAQQHKNMAYLCLHWIPATALSSSESTSSIQESETISVMLLESALLISGKDGRMKGIRYWRFTRITLFRGRAPTGARRCMAITARTKKSNRTI
jgi:hypothetical protein